MLFHKSTCEAQRKNASFSDCSNNNFFISYTTGKILLNLRLHGFVQGLYGFMQKEQGAPVSVRPVGHSAVSSGLEADSGSAEGSGVAGASASAGASIFSEIMCTFLAGASMAVSRGLVEA